jgi:Rubrerythrin
VGKTLKVSEAVYESICKIAKEHDRSISEVADSLLGGNVDALNTAVKALANNEKVQEAFDGILRRKPNGVVYMCESCGHPLEQDREPEECPWCGAKLNWKAIPDQGSNWLGWGLAGLLVLSALGMIGGQRNQV